MFVKILVFCACLAMTFESCAKPEITTKANLTKRIEKFIKSDETKELKDVVDENSSAVVLLHTFSKTAKKDSLIYNSAIKHRENKSQLRHCVSSATLISPSGDIVTTYEAAKNSYRIVVSIDSENLKISNNSKMRITKNDYEAKVVKLIPELNLAFLKITPKRKEKLSYLPLGNDAKLINNPDKIILNGAVAVGKAQGEMFVTAETPANSKNNFSMIVRLIDKAWYEKVNGVPRLCLENLILGTCALPENYGGPVIDDNGKLIGVVDYNINKDLSGTTAYAIPVSVVKQGLKLANPLFFNNASNANFGISVEDLKKYPKNLSPTTLDLPKGKVVGVRIKAIEVFSVAEDCGLKQGDVILKCNNEIIKNAKTFKNMLQTSIGEPKIALVIFRNNTEIGIELSREPEQNLS